MRDIEQQSKWLLDIFEQCYPNKSSFESMIKIQEENEKTADIVKELNKNLKVEKI